jgi:hypothetical protein
MGDGILDGLLKGQAKVDETLLLVILPVAEVHVRHVYEIHQLYQPL